MRPAPLLLTLSFLVTTGCVDDTAPHPAVPSPPTDGPALDASVDDARGSERDAGTGSSTLDASRTGAPARGAPDAGAGCRTLVSDSLIEHSCFHARGGPYREVSASSEAVDVSRAHTAFRIALAPALSGYSGTIAYRVRTTGAYALFTSPGARLSLVDPLAPAPFSAHPAELCPELPRVAAHTLVAGVHEILVSSDQPDAMIVIESLDQGGFEDTYRVVCDEVPAAPPSGATSRDAGTDAGVLTANATPSAPGPGTARPPRAAQPAPDASAEASSATPERDDVASAKPNRDDAASVNEMQPAPAVDTTAGVVAAPAEPAPAFESTPAAPACRLDPVLEHACLHVKHGPFAEIEAAGAGSAVPAISPPHTVYALRLGAEAGRVAYQPVLPGQHVFYLGADLPLALHAPGGALAPSHVEPVAGCPGLARAYVFNLTAGTRYEAEVGPGGATTQVLVESVESLTFNDWSTRFESCT